MAPLIDLFQKRSDQPKNQQTKFDTLTHSILDIYKIDETKKWVVAVQDNQRKKLLRRKLTGIFSLKKLFENLSIRHYSQLANTKQVPPKKMSQKLLPVGKNSGKFSVRYYSRYANTKEVPPVEVFHMVHLYNEDKFEKKVNLSVGAYRTTEGKPWILPVVKKAEKIILGDESLNKEYLPATGLPAFTDAATKLVLTPDSKELKECKAFGVQTLSGTGALRIAAEILYRILGYKTYYVSKPTWGNHNNIFQHSGFTTKKEYRYWDSELRGLNINGMLCDLCAAPENSVIIFHACAHNPTGSDPTQEQWKVIAEVVKEKRLFPLFDAAYLGFATGDLVEDCWAPRYFVEQGIETIICQSFAKNFGLYSERIGNCVFVVSDPKIVHALKSNIAIVVRGSYSNPPAHGARIVATVLNDRSLYDEWLHCLLIMACRIHSIRKELRQALEKLKTPGSWSHITDQIGMFSFTGLNEAQSKNMIQKHHIYMLKSGRISMCGVTPKNVDYVAQAIHESVTKVK